MIQNVQHLDAIEQINGITLFSIRDIGLFKLMIVSNRQAYKHVYNLDLNTDTIELLFSCNSLKKNWLNITTPVINAYLIWIKKQNPLDDTIALLAFDDAAYAISDFRHTDSSDRLDIL